MTGRYGIANRLWHVALIGAILALGAVSPYVVFKVTPVPTGNRGAEAPPGVTSHAPSPGVTAFPEDALEKQVRADIYKWCRFCHTTERNGEHLLGPNLHGIIGQRAGTTPNFVNYSDAMIQARENGLVWSDEALMAYVADPHAFMPGTNMAISIGPIPDRAVQARVINILKKETMGDAVRIEGSPPQ